MTTSNFAPVLAFTLRYEGGKADNPKDPGGRTNEGVTQRSFTAWLKAGGRPAADVYAMTPAERDAIYRGSYWDVVHGDALPAGVDLAVFDYGVNSGPSRALAAFAKAGTGDAAKMAAAICASRMSFLRALSTFATFGRGWTARVAACEALAVKMAEHVTIGVDSAAPATPATATKLLTTAAAAKAKASTAKAKAAGALALAGAGALTQVPGAPSAVLPLALVALAMAGAGLFVAWLAWRAHVHQARATAYAAVAAPAVPASPVPPVAGA